MSSDIAVVIEHLEGALAEVSFEMLAKGRELAAAGGGQLWGVLIGHDVTRLAGELGAADGVAVVEHAALAHYTPEAYERAAAAALQALGPRVALVASSSMGLDLAAGLSGTLGWPLCGYCKDVTLTGGQITQGYTGQEWSWGQRINFSFGDDTVNQIVLRSAGDSFEVDNFAGAVPEPTTWALMIMGFGGVGAMVRRRRTAYALA